VWFVLGWLALGLGGMQARSAESTAEIIGGYLWAVLFFALAFWPRRAPAGAEEPESGASEAATKPWDKGRSE
jgi:hypothetical protein